MTRRKRKSETEESDESEEEVSSSNKKAKGDRKYDSDAENADDNGDSGRNKQQQRTKTSSSSSSRPRVVSADAPSSKGLADDFDFGDGSLEDMQRLMNLYQNSSQSSAARGTASPHSSANEEITPTKAKAYPISKRGWPASRDDSPASLDTTDDIPDPAAEWLKSFRLCCKECGVDEFATDTLYVLHHVQIHGDDRPYKCQNLDKDHVTPKTNPDCGSCFRQRHHYKEHIRGVRREWLLGKCFDGNCR